MKFLADYRLPLPLVLQAFAVNEYFPKTCIFNSLRNLQRRPRRRGRESLTRIKGKQMRGPAEWTEGERSGKGEEGGGKRGKGDNLDSFNKSNSFKSAEICV